MGSVVALYGLSFSAACAILVPWPRIEPVPPTLQRPLDHQGSPKGDSLDFREQTQANNLRVGWVATEHLSSD